MKLRVQCVCSLLHFLAVIVVDSTYQCGFPGKPRQGSLSSSNQVFASGEEVTYQCNEGFVLFGPPTRKCQDNGTWSDVIPECRENVALGKSSLQSSTLWNYEPQLAVDANPETCSFTPRSTEQRWWQVHLGDGLNVQSVAITMSPGSFQKFTIFIIELLEGNKAMYKSCSKFEGKFETNKAVFLCNDGLGHPGQFVYIRDDRAEEEYFGLCEVEVFEYRNETQDCGEPELPLNSFVEWPSDNEVVYSCSKGYRAQDQEGMTHSSRRLCVHGAWKGPAPPRCTEVVCSDPFSVKDGFIEVSNFKGKYIYGSVATYHCNPGHILWGNASRLCSEQGLWTGHQPQCKPITCGPPPDLANGQYKLLNGSSTSWLSQASYSCRPGYRLVFPHIQCPTCNQTNSLNVLCSDAGSWSPTEFQCIFDPLMVVNLKDGADWTAAFEENGSFKFGTLVTIGTLGALVFLVVIIVITFFWQQRRHSQSQQSQPPSPTSPPKVLSRSSTNQLIADVALGLASHFDGPEPLTCYLKDCSRSAGDGGSEDDEEGPYASLHSEYYASVRQPDGRADDLVHCYEPIGLQRSQSSTGIGPQPRDSCELYAQVDRSKKKKILLLGDRESLASSNDDTTMSNLPVPSSSYGTEERNREPLYATIGHKQRPIMKPHP